MEYLSAGVFVQELNSGARPIAGVGTTTLALLGKAERGPINTPVLVTSMGDFYRTFGNIARYRVGATDYEFFYLGMALSLFFANGGTRAYIVRIANTTGGPGHAAVAATADWTTLWTRTAKNEGIWGNRISDILTEDSNNQGVIVGEVQDISTGTFTLNFHPVKPYSVQFTYNSGAGPTTIVCHDGGDGKLYDASGGQVGTINYDSGVCAITSPTPLTLIGGITYGYKMYVYEIYYQDNPQDRGTKRLVERFDNLDLVNEAGQRYFPNVVNDEDTGSEYVKITKLSGGVPSPLPSESYLENGAEGDTISDTELQAGLDSLDHTTDMMMLVAPDTQFAGIASSSKVLIDYADNRGDCFAILETPASLKQESDMSEVVKYVQATLNKNTSRAALYHPWVRIADPLAQARKVDFPPAAIIAGIYARTDITRNVSKTPAGITDGALRGVLELTYSTNKSQRDVIYPARVNPLVDEPQTGLCVWGGRTLSLDSLWKYIGVRRLFQFLEKSTFLATHWVVFENNDATTRTRVRLQMEAFLLFLFQQDYFAGKTPSEAFYVVCDESNNPQSVVDQGLLICDIAVAPKNPAEYVVYRFQQKTATATV